VDDARLGRLVRAYRNRRRWRQVDLGGRAGVSRSVVSDLELGRVDGMTLATVRQVLAALGLSAEVAVRGGGAEADRLLDAGHARLVAATTRWVTDLGWLTQVEVTYSVWGERGSIDVLAWQEAARSLLVVEVKTELASIEATLREHDEKVRLALGVARDRFGWEARGVSRLLVLPDQRTQRRRVAVHGDVLGRVYPARSRAVRAWCRRPTGPLSGLLFLPDSTTSRTKVVRGPRQRVRASR